MAKSSLLPATTIGISCILWKCGKWSKRKFYRITTTNALPGCVWTVNCLQVCKQSVWKWFHWIESLSLALLWILNAEIIILYSQCVPMIKCNRNNFRWPLTTARCSIWLLYYEMFVTFRPLFLRIENSIIPYVITITVKCDRQKLISNKLHRKILSKHNVTSNIFHYHHLHCARWTKLKFKLHLIFDEHEFPILYTRAPKTWCWLTVVGTTDAVYSRIWQYNFMNCITDSQFSSWRIMKMNCIIPFVNFCILSFVPISVFRDANVKMWNNHAWNARVSKMAAETDRTPLSDPSKQNSVSVSV